jgi:hypothetical protein
MAIKTYTENGKKFFEVYLNGHDKRGRREYNGVNVELKP